MKYRLALILVLSVPARAQICAPTGVIQPNGQVTATLDGSGCTLADGTWFADYLINFPSRGSWSASVTPGDGVTAFTAILRNESGARIDSGAVINRPVEAGSYHVLVNGPAPNQGGGYTLHSSFSGVPNVLCRPTTMIGTVRPVNGSLGSGSCTLPDGSAYDGYQLTLYGTGTVDIAINANGFTPLLILRTSDGQAIGSNSTADDSGVVHLTLPGVGSDTYTLVATVSSPDQAGGTYSLSATFAPDADETCVALAAVNDSQQYNGTIGPGSCNFNLPGRDDFAPFNYYMIHVDTAGAVQASIDTTDFSALLLLLDADGNTIAQDTDSGGSGIPLILRQLPPGDYRLAVFNEDSFGGNYTLNYQYTPGPGPSCPVVPLNSGDQPNGTLSASSCRDAAFPSDVYQIVLPSDGSVSLSLSSTDFSTFLDLHDAKDNELTWGSQSSDGSSSLMTVNLPAGTYYVDAASMDFPGDYALSYSFTPGTLAACPSPLTLPYSNGYIHNAQLGSASCQGADGREADYYHFSLPFATTEAVFMISGSLVPYIDLYQQDGTPLRSDQNSYAGSNAVIVQYLPAGDYLVRARSADPTAQGPYDLDLLFAPGPPQLCSPMTLPASGSVSGQTSFTSCAWYDKTFADVYQLNITGATQIVTITAQSNAFDTFLILMDAKGSVLSSDDNSGGGTNSLIVQTLDPGTYYVIVKPANDATSAGNYVLTSGAAPLAGALKNTTRGLTR